MPIDPYCARVLKMLSVSPVSAAQSHQQRRQALRDLAALATGDPVPVEAITDLSIPSEAGDIPVRRYLPVAGGAGPAIVYLHGGGWTAGGLDTHDGVCRALASASGFSVFAVDYRLAPEHPYPAGLSDAVAAVRWIAAEAEPLGIDPARLVLAGDSAGANLAAAAAAILGKEPSGPLARLVLICPILDLVEERPSRISYGDDYFISRSAFADDLAAYAPAPVDIGAPQLSPIRTESVSGLPATDIHVAELDPFRDEGEAFGTLLSQSGIETRLTRHPGMIHYFYALPRLIPYARKALEQIGTELREALL